MHESGPFSIPAIRDFVPEKCKPWIMIAIVIVFQLSGIVYLAAASEMVGSLSLLQEDIMMAGYASLVGMSLTFVIMYRLKFRFTSKVSLLTCCSVLIVSNIIIMNTSNVPLLVFVSFVAGIFRMWGTFECNSTIQLWLTPKRDLSVFFCFIYLLVQSSIQFSGLITIHIAHFAIWEYMHLLVIGLLGCVIIVVLLLFRTIRTLPKMPLFGIDWLGALLWAVTLLSLLFVTLYGDHYDWFSSVYIRMGSVVVIVSLLLNLWRASFVRHPFIALQTWRYKIVRIAYLLILIYNIFLAPAHIFEHLYMEKILHYDTLYLISLNWVVFAGVVAGGLFCWRTFAVRKWAYKTMTIIGLSAIAGYLILSYFTIDYNQTRESFILPLFLRSFGYVILSIVMLTSMVRIPFSNFFQSVSVQSFISACCGAAIGDALIGQVLKVVMKKNAMLLSAGLDSVNPAIERFNPGELMTMVQQQALMVSMKEIYGWMALSALFFLLMILVKESKIRPRYALIPTYHAVRRLIKRETEPVD